MIYCMKEEYEEFLDAKGSSPHWGEDDDDDDDDVVYSSYVVAHNARNVNVRGGEIKEGSSSWFLGVCAE